LTLIPRIPASVTRLTQQFPIKWGTGAIYLTTVRNVTRVLNDDPDETEDADADADEDTVVNVHINGTLCTTCIDQNGCVVLQWGNEDKYHGTSTSIVITLSGSSSIDSSIDSKAKDLIQLPLWIWNGEKMRDRWLSSQHDHLIDYHHIAASCVPNSTTVAWSTNMTAFRKSMLSAGLEHRFEYVQAADFLKAVNDSITRCIGRQDGTILPMPKQPESWNNYSMLYNQTEVEWYVEDVYRRLWKGLESVIASYSIRSNASPIQKLIVQIYHGKGSSRTLQDVERDAKLTDLKSEIKRMEVALDWLRTEKDRLEM